MTLQSLGIQIISAGILSSLSDEQRADLDYCVLPDFPSVRKCSVAWREDTDHLFLIKETLQLLRENVLPQMVYTEVITNRSEQ